jgi:hypothetical protein
MGNTFALNVLQKAGSLFYNCKQFFSRVLQGVADSECRFVFMDVGAYGKQSDGGSFSASTLHHFLEDFESTLLKPASFEGSGTEMPFIILDDEVCPLKTYLMKPLRERICHLKCVFFITGCRKQGGALSVPLVS